MKCHRETVFVLCECRKTRKRFIMCVNRNVHSKYFKYWLTIQTDRRKAIPIAVFKRKC